MCTGALCECERVEIDPVTDKATGVCGFLDIETTCLHVCDELFDVDGCTTYARYVAHIGNDFLFDGSPTFLVGTNEGCFVTGLDFELETFGTDVDTHVDEDCLEFGGGGWFVGGGWEVFGVHLMED